MIFRSRLKVLLFACGSILLFCISTYLFISDRDLENLMTRSLARYGFSCKAGSFGKAFPLGINARNISIADERGPLLNADKVTVRLRLMPLLRGSVVIAVNATIGQGDVRGEIMPFGNGEVKVGNLRLEELPFIATVTGAKAKGLLGCQAVWQQAKQSVNGKVQIEIKDADLSGIKIGSTPLPDASYRTVQGSLSIAGNKAVLTSLTLDGAGLYVRLKGDMPLQTPQDSAPLNMSLELMPQPEFLEKQKFVFLLLLKYQTTPGRYEIPIRGTLAKPAIS